MIYAYDLSVILPVYDVEKYLPDCLDSLLKQSFTGRLQVVLVEDKSPDNSLAICQQYAAIHENIILIEHVENGGSAVARNTGLEQAQGEYYVFVDPDDLVPDDALEVLHAHIHESGADIVKGSNTSFSLGNLPKLAAYSVSQIENFHNDDCLTVLLKHEKLRGHPWGKIFRASTFADERFISGYRMAEDLLYCTQLFAKARHVKLIPDNVYQYRIHSNGATGLKYETGAYLCWLKGIGKIEKYISTPAQRRACQELKIRTLTQLAREARLLRGSNLKAVAQKIYETETKWLPSFVELVFKDKISMKSIIRFFKFHIAMKNIRSKLRECAN